MFETPPTWITELIGLGAGVIGIIRILIALRLINRTQKENATSRAAEAVETSTKVEIVRSTLEKQGDVLDAKLNSIHESVNSEREGMIERLEKMHSEILRLNLVVKNDADLTPRTDRA